MLPIKLSSVYHYSHNRKLFKKIFSRRLVYMHNNYDSSTYSTYPIAISVPSFSTVISMSMSTGMWKNSGHSSTP